MDLSYELLGNPLTAWITALGIALAINLMVGIAKMAIMHHLSAIVGRTDTELDDSILEVVRKTSQALILFVTLLVGTRYLALPERVDLIIRGAATIAVFTQLGLWAGAGLDFWLSRYKTRAMASDAGAGTATGLAAMSFLGRLFLWALVLLLALDNLGVDVTAMVAGLGVGGIAVALAVQNILGDLFASLSIVVDKPFVIGDFIIVDAYMGKVEHVGLKTTRVRSLGGEELVFANSDLLSARVRNFKRMRERRILFRFGVLYQTTPDQLERIPEMVRQIIGLQSMTRFDRAHFINFGDSSYDFEVVYWMQDPDYNKYMDTQQAINLALVRAFEKEGIGFAYPTRTLFVEGAVNIEKPQSIPTYGSNT